MTMPTFDDRMADTDTKILVGKGEQPAWLTLALANRHGLVTGATGTGKTVTLQVLAEGFSRAGVPVFAADIKGDLSGIAARGEAKPDFVKRAKDIGFGYADDDPELKATDGCGLIDLKDLRELLSYLSKNAKEISARYGNVAVNAVGAVQRQLLVLENQGGNKFFGEPALSIADLMKTAPDGRG